ncbi:hypothetical protein DW706_09185 [Bacteroides caccae]|nr:hypothetical protein DW706_09185 [Bacteroides caccae]
MRRRCGEQSDEKPQVRFFFRFAITHLVGSRLYQRDIPLNVIADYLFRSEPGTRICYHFSRAAATFPEESAISLQHY